MNITFDARTCADWLSRSVFAVKVLFIQKGCEGTKVDVQETFSREGLLEFPVSENLSVFVNQLDTELLDGAVLTYVKGKWIFTSSKVVKRCGCGSSFAFSGLPHPGKQQKWEFLHIPGHNSDTENWDQSSESGLTWESDTISVFQNPGLYFSEHIQGIYKMPKGETTWYLLLNNSTAPSKILVDESFSQVKIRILVLGAQTDATKIEIIGEIQSNDSLLDIRILTLVKSHEAAKISVIGKVSEWSKNYEMQVHQSNIFLDASGTISGIPGLQVASNDGIAEHSATFHSLGDTSLEYLTGRWLSKKQARTLLVNAQMVDMFPLLDQEHLSRMGKFE